MVGIVIVSHSQKIAEGARELALQMAPDAPVAAAGGMADGGIGTDLDKIIDGIESVMSPDGVIMLVDLGSAIMTSECAIEECSDPDAVTIVDAPVVESAIFGAVEASIGSSKESIIKTLTEAKSQAKF